MSVSVMLKFVCDAESCHAKSCRAKSIVYIMLKAIHVESSAESYVTTDNITNF